jgi:hypothetical protein
MALSPVTFKLFAIPTAFISNHLVAVVGGSVAKVEPDPQNFNVAPGGSMAGGLGIAISLFTNIQRNNCDARTSSPRPF